MQQALAGWTANILSKQLKSKVEIGSVNLGFLNRVIVNDMVVYEPTGKQMASIARVSASINLFSLLSGQVNIGTAQLFGVNATLYKDTPDSQPNYLFLIDAFQKEEQEEPSEQNLHVGSFIMRHANVTYDVKSEETHPNTIDINHLHLKDCGMNAQLRCLTNDSINVSIHRLQAQERNAGISIRNSQLHLVANPRSATLSDFQFSLPHSHLAFDSLTVQYGNFQKDSTFQIQSTLCKGLLTPSDLAFVHEKLSHFTTPIQMEFRVGGNDQELFLNDCILTSDDGALELRAQGTATHLLRKSQRHFRGNIQTLRIENRELLHMADAFSPEHGKEALIEEIRQLTYAGTLEYDADGSVYSKGNVNTGLGDADYELLLDADRTLTGNVSGDSIHLGKILNNEHLGTTSFQADMALHLADMHSMPTGQISGEVASLYYQNYNYQQIHFDALSTASQIDGNISIDDEQVKANANFAYADQATKDIQLDLLIDKFCPNKLNLTKQYPDEDLTLNATAHLQGQDFTHLFGEIALNDIHLSTPTDHYHMDGIWVNATHLGNGENEYQVKSDVLSGSIQGEVSLVDVAQSITNQLARHLPIFFQSKEVPNTRFTYDFTLTDAPILHHITDADFAIDEPIHLSGDVSSAQHLMALQLDAPQVSYNGKPYDHVQLACDASADMMAVHALASTFQESKNNDTPPTSTQIDVRANVHDNNIDSDLRMNITGRTNISLQMLPLVHLHDSLGSMKTDITLRQSHAVINDTTWTVSPSHISLYKKNIECHHVKFANNNTNSFLAIDGKASSSPSDSLVATLNNLEIKYFMSLVNFSAVRFAGKASGRAVVNNVMGTGMPDMRAYLYVEDLSVQEGPLGDANITAHWDKEVDGISVMGRIIDLYKVPDGLSGREKSLTGITTVNGWISPAKNDMNLMVNTLNTNAKFVHGFLRGVFKEVSGYVTGPINIIGPLNNVNIVGDAVPNMNLRLRATNVPYHIEGDTLRMRPYLFDFQDISIYDRFGHRSKINGQVTHRNMKNFAYHFKADLHELLAYDETEFNSDKFLATVFTDGTLSIDGSDGHPLYVNASVTPTRGSVFAYDAATPDAITGSSFIEFRDRDSLLVFNPHLFDKHPEEEEEAATPVVKDSLTIVNEAKKNYSSDIFINFDIDLTPACEVKLRMDNIEDGYMRTFGNAKITAKWYNKGSFQMFGNYNISSGSYRLYLQDIIFRDLALQPGSMVEFNGNPFDANIHLICHHTINSVPLSDLTATTAFSQNNKVKVICILDITGKLGNMDFKFDMDIPNVNEEVRQLVRSMINSEEEMNTQMIYLLGLGRFYPNEYARANGGNNSGQAVNSLLSSTLSGQINQMLSSMIGNNTNWNFGSSLTTGEKGWDDLDVEGILSGRLLDERLLINGAFGYRDNALTNQTSFIGDFEVKWRMNQKGTLYIKAYNQTNDRYFTKSTLNTQGLGLSWQHDFEVVRKRMREKETQTTRYEQGDTLSSRSHVDADVDEP